LQRPNCDGDSYEINLDISDHAEAIGKPSIRAEGFSRLPCRLLVARGNSRELYAGMCNTFAQPTVVSARIPKRSSSGVPAEPRRCLAMLFLLIYLPPPVSVAPNRTRQQPTSPIRLTTFRQSGLKRFKEDEHSRRRTRKPGVPPENWQVAGHHRWRSPFESVEMI